MGMENSHIASHPEVMDGAWCIVGQRIPASSVKSFHEAGYSVAAIQKEYPTLSVEQVEAAIAFQPPPIPEGVPSDLQRFMTKEVFRKRGDPDALVDAVEHLAKSLGFAVSLAANGDPKLIDTLMAGAEGYAHSEAVSIAAFAALTRKSPPVSRGA